MSETIHVYTTQERLLVQILEQQKRTNELLGDLIIAMSEALEPEQDHPDPDELPPAWEQPDGSVAPV